MIAVALTGLGSVHDRDQTLARGFQHCMVKPLAPEQLVEAIENLLISPPAR
jgi:DNA-binding response OmpR family regulator